MNNENIIFLFVFVTVVLYPLHLPQFFFKKEKSKSLIVIIDFFFKKTEAFSSKQGTEKNKKFLPRKLRGFMLITTSESCTV